MTISKHLIGYKSQVTNPKSQVTNHTSQITKQRRPTRECSQAFFMDFIISLFLHRGRMHINAGVDFGFEVLLHELDHLLLGDGVDDVVILGGGDNRLILVDLAADVA